MMDARKVAILVLAPLAISFAAMAGDDRGQRKGEGDADKSALAVPLVDKNATTRTRELFLLLRKLAETRLLFGHQDSTAYGVDWSGGRDRSEVKEVTGSFPAVYGWDIGHLGRERDLDAVDFERMKQLITNAHARGGINTISWHMDNPVTGRRYLDRRARANHVSNVRKASHEAHSDISARFPSAVMPMFSPAHLLALCVERCRFGGAR
jgi:hypothetical protein